MFDVRFSSDLQPMTFAGIDPEFADRANAAVWLQGIPYDGTSTWGKGADRGFDAFLDAAENMELYDEETRTEPYRHGIHLLPPLTGFASPEAMVEAVRASTAGLLADGKLLTFFGGEHSISIGIIRAFYEAIPDISVLQVDAHADLRPTYLGSACNHACALHDASRHTNVVQVGIRSMDAREEAHMDRDSVFMARDIVEAGDGWMDRAVALLGDEVYITFDLDALDPAILPATGTPEPGGLAWYPTLRFLRKVFAERRVRGFDLVELAPIEGQRASQFLAAKLYYKMLSYYVESHDR